MKKRPFVLSVLILAGGGLIAKIIGAFYRIPLTYVLGAQGLGIYQLVFPLFSLCLILSSSGVPTAIAKLVAEKNALGKTQDTKALIKISFISLGVLGLVFGLIIALGANLFASWQGNALAGLSYLVIAPAVLLVAFLSVFRGVFQGMGRMSPTALSQIIEQLFKLGLGLSFAYLLIDRGIEYGALGAVLGVTASELIAVLYMMLTYFFTRKKPPAQKKTEEKPQIRLLFKEFIKTVVPITVSASILPFILLVDSFIIVNLLNGMGFSDGQSTILYGLHSGVVNSVINMPVVLTMAVAVAIVPVLSSGKAKNDLNLNETAKKAIRITLLIAFPCTLGLVLLSPQIIAFLYDASLSGSLINEFSVASRLLSVSALSVLSLSLLQVFTSILQSLGKTKAPMYSLLLAGIIKISLSIILIQIPSLNILGAAIANVLCFGAAAAVNYCFLQREFDVGLSIKRVLLPLVAAGAGLVFAVLALNKILGLISVYIKVPVILFVAALVYAAILLCSGGAGDFTELIKKFKKEKT